MVVLVEEAAASRLPSLKGYVRVSPMEVEDRVIDMVRSGEVVVAVYGDAYARLPRVIESIESNGGNPYLYEPISLKHAESIGWEALPYYIEVREQLLYASKPWMAPFRMAYEKRVSRRALLTSPLNAVTVYVGAPVLLDEGACASIVKCSSCISACPTGALKGKPPTVYAESCTSCGICAAKCPFDLLAMPGWHPKKAADGVMKLKKILGNPTVLIAERRSAPIIDELIDSLSAPIIVELVDSLGWVSERVLVGILEAGANGIIVYSGEEGGEKREDLLSILSLALQGLPIHLVKRVEDVKRIKGLLEVSSGSNATIGWKSMRVRTISPVRGILEVSSEGCTLCGACVAACPTRALQLQEGGGSLSLAFSHDRCVACRICEAICPEKAVKVSQTLDGAYTGKWVTLVSDELAKCKRCGAPIGPKRKLEKVANLLKRRGYDESIIEAVWLCESCKRARALSWAQRSPDRSRDAGPM